MCEISAQRTVETVAEGFRAAGSLVILTHSRPDGDGLGCLVAIARSARAAGKTVRTFIADPIPRRYAFLLADQAVVTEDLASLADAADRIVVVDTCAFEQLDDLEGILRPRREKVIVIDHHVTAEDVGAVQWTDSSASAAGVMVGELLVELGWPVDEQAAEALVAAVTSDTGWFRFSNTDARTLRAVANWLEAGAQADRVYERLYQSDRPERLGLLQRLLGSLELHHDGRLAVMSLRKRDFAETGASEDETENLINESLRLASVEAAVLLVENTACVRVSFRSRGCVNVAELAGQFGGGGHIRAAGCRVQEDLDELKRQVIEAFQEPLCSSSSSSSSPV